MTYVVAILATHSVEEDWEPAFGTYGWLWISLGGIALFVTYKLIQRSRYQATERRVHEEIWGQRDGESEGVWQQRVQQQKAEEEKRRLEVLQLVAEDRARPAKLKNFRRGDFDPPGGWGATGPDNG